MSATCDRIAELTLAEAEGKMLTASDMTLRQRHLGACSACRREADVLGLLRMPETGAPHFTVSAAERAETIDRVLAALDAPALEDAPLAPVEPERATSDDFGARRVRRRAAWAAGLAAAAAVLVLAVRIARSPSVPEGLAPVARVALASGPELTAGMALVEGQEIAATTGDVSLVMGPDIVLLLDAGSRARLARVRRDAAEIALGAGTVHASVTPNTPGPRLAISTRDGRVEVTGTLFSVEAKDGGSELRVLRGSVKVSAPGHRTSRVAALQAQRLGADATRPMSVKEQEGELAAMRRIGLLETSEPSVLQVRSQPMGARVLLDGEAIGTTPLSAEVKTGHRHLVVASAERNAEEWIDLHAGSMAIREFDLTMRPAAVAEPDAAPLAEVPKRELKHSRTIPRLPAEELLRRAQALRSRQDWPACAAAYRELLSQYPASPVTEASWVSFGEVLGDHLGDAKGALKACDAYLDRSPGGVVAGEAMACRIRALRALGRRADESAAIEEFLSRFPGAVQAAGLRRRLNELR